MGSKQISSWSRQGDWEACVVQARLPAGSSYLTYFIPGGKNALIDPETPSAKPEGESRVVDHCTGRYEKGHGTEKSWPK